MALFKFLRKQLASVIEWKPQDPDLLLWKYPARTDELKNASKIIIAPGQGCVLVYEGKITDVLDTPGTYNLKTSNHPFITSLLKIAQFFESEHKVYLYFYRKAEIVNQGWGTASPIKYVDAVYNIPIQLSAYGNFSYRLTDAAMFYTEYVGSAERYTTQDFQDMAQGRIIQLLTAHLSEKKIPYTEIDGHVHELAIGIKEHLNTVFDTVGAVLTDFRIEGNSFDEETQVRIGKVADVTADTMAAKEAGLSFVELEKLRALRDAAKNEGGMAGAGVALGAGMNMGKLFTEKIDEVTQSDTESDPVKQLQKLKLLLDEQIITQAEFDSKKKEILDRI